MVGGQAAQTATAKTTAKAEAEAKTKTKADPPPAAKDDCLKGKDKSKMRGLLRFVQNGKQKKKQQQQQRQSAAGFSVIVLQNAMRDG